MRLSSIFALALLIVTRTTRADDTPPTIEFFDYQPTPYGTVVWNPIVDAKGDFALGYSMLRQVFYLSNGRLGLVEGHLAGFEGGAVTVATPWGTWIEGPNWWEFRSIEGFFAKIKGRCVVGGAMLGERQTAAGASAMVLRTADGREREVSVNAVRLASRDLLLIAEQHFELEWGFFMDNWQWGCSTYWTQVPGQDPVELGPRDGNVFIRGANSRLDFFGTHYVNGRVHALGIVDGQTLEFAPEDGMNVADPIAITIDGQIIGRHRDTEDNRKGTPLWVVKNGIKHDLMPALVERIGPVGQWETMAASETGWVIGYDAADPMPHIWRIKIRVSDDVDEDGLLDVWEQEGGGIDVDGDGTIELDLWALGARPDHKDLFVEFDEGSIPLREEARAMMVEAFENAPLNNPDGTRGIRLHAIRDESSVAWQPGEIMGSSGFVHSQAFKGFKARHFGTIAERAAPNAARILEAKAKAFRYAVIYDGLVWPNGKPLFQGNAEGGGNDMALDFGQDISNDGKFDAEDQAAIFMHELGHTLGLFHGGGIDDPLLAPPSYNGKPNYPSIMNYVLAFKSDWNRRFWRLDFCRESLVSLDENCLFEGDGIPSSTYRNYWMPFRVGPGQARVMKLARLDGSPVDFDGSGDIERQACVSADLNFAPGISECDQPSPGERLNGHNDWQRIKLQVFPDGKESLLAIEIPGGCGDPAVLAELNASLQDPGCDAGDLDCSGEVDTADVSLMLMEFGDCDGCEADLDGDGNVGPADLSLLLQLFSWHDGGSGGGDRK